MDDSYHTGGQHSQSCVQCSTGADNHNALRRAARRAWRPPSTANSSRRVSCAARRASPTRHRPAPLLLSRPLIGVLYPPPQQEGHVERFRQELEARGLWRKEDHGEQPAGGRVSSNGEASSEARPVRTRTQHNTTHTHETTQQNATTTQQHNNTRNHRLLHAAALPARAQLRPRPRAQDVGRLARVARAVWRRRDPRGLCLPRARAVLPRVGEPLLLLGAGC